MWKKYGYNIVGLAILVAGAGVSAAVAVAAWTAAGTLVQKFGGFAVCMGVFAIFAGGLTASFILSLSPRVAEQWENAVVLRLGRFVGLRGPGLFWVIPLVDRVAFWIDLRVRTTGFAAEKTLTRDTVPINVDAVLFWIVTDARKAALEVADYEEAVAWAAQTALRDIMGTQILADILVGRESIDEQLRTLIDQRTHDWGITVKSVEIRDVVIPPALEDAMSRQAQAEREKQARVILGDAEVEIANKFEQASKHYAKSPIAFQLRAMNILYEGVKEKGSLMVVPSPMVTSMMDAGGYAGLAALGRLQEQPPKEE
jgi:regulator of protease activity HflC (stomatin/prohibitin superfamily)